MFDDTYVILIFNIIQYIKLLCTVYLTCNAMVEFK